MRKKKKIGIPIRTLLAMLSVALLLGGAMGGTLAWLTSTSDEVENTFTPSTIEIELKETGATKDGTVLKNSYKMVPGNKISKDPEITFAKESEPCWLFVKVEKSENFDTYMTYEMAEGWTELTIDSGVYYREVEGSGTPAMIPITTPAIKILKNDEVSVRESVTKEQMEALTEDDNPTLTFTAHAIQKANIDSAADAWETLNP